MRIRALPLIALLGVALLAALLPGAPARPALACSPTATPETPPQVKPPPAIPTALPQTRYRAMVNQADTVLYGRVREGHSSRLIVHVETYYIARHTPPIVDLNVLVSTCEYFSVPVGAQVFIFARESTPDGSLYVSAQQQRPEEAVLIVEGEQLTAAINRIPFGGRAELEATIQQDPRARPRPADSAPGSPPLLYLWLALAPLALAGAIWAWRRRGRG